MMFTNFTNRRNLPSIILLGVLLITIITPLRVLAVSKNFTPQNQEFWIGTIQHGAASDKLDGIILVGFKDNGWPSPDFTYRAWITFDIEELPAAACIDSVELIGNCFSPSTNGGHSLEAIQLIDRFPPLLSVLALDSQIVEGRVYSACNCMTTTGVHSFYLGEEARVDLKNAAQSSDLKSFSVGLKEPFPRDFGAWYGKGENAPILRVTYTLPVSERPVLTLSENKLCLGEEYTISWTTVAGANRYTLYNANTGSVAASIIGGSTTSIIMQTHVAGSFPFTLKAHNDCGPGPASEVITVEVIDMPLTPTIITDPQDPFCVNEPYYVSWLPVSSATGYEIAVDRGPWFNVISKGGETSYLVENPTLGAHSYYVRALNSCGESPRSDLFNITVNGIPSITSAPISDIMTPVADEPYTISWIENASATNYELWENPSTIWSLIYSGPEPSFAITNSEIRTYYYYVIASNGCGTSNNSPQLELTIVEACCGLYTSGQTGNTDCGSEGSRNLADITTLIDHVFLTKTELCCANNGDVNTDTKWNLADITRLIDHVFLTKAETASCQ